MQHFCQAGDETNSGCDFTMLTTVNLADIFTHPDDSANCLHFPLHEQRFETIGSGHSACRSHCNDSDIMTMMLSNSNRNGDGDVQILGMPQFWMFFVCMVFSWTAMTVVSNLADTICFQLLADKPHLYGKQRLWAAIGWGLFSLIAGYLVDRLSRGETLKDYRVVFLLMTVMLAFDLFFSFRLEVNVVLYYAFQNVVLTKCERRIYIPVDRPPC